MADLPALMERVMSGEIIEGSEGDMTSHMSGRMTGRIAVIERWLGLSEQGSATDKWIVCRLFPRTTDMGRQAGRA
jgi:hypothetical protein